MSVSQLFGLELSRSSRRTLNSVAKRKDVILERACRTNPSSLARNDSRATASVHFDGDRLAETDAFWAAGMWRTVAPIG